MNLLSRSDEHQPVNLTLPQTNILLQPESSHHIQVRVGGWLPNIQGDIGTDIHTAYFISVTMTHGNESWRVGHRYSEFWNFYCAVYPRICQAMPQVFLPRF